MPTNAQHTNFISAKASENLLHRYWNLNEAATFTNVTGNTNVAEVTENYPFLGKRGLQIVFAETSASTFQPPTTIETSLSRDGLYIVGYRLYKSDPSADVTVDLLIYKNNVLIDTLTQNLYSSSGFEDGVWNCYYQNYEFEQNDVLEFQIRAQSDTIGTQVFFDGFKLELDDRNLGFPSIYTPVPELNTQWHSRLDFSGTQNITANTDTGIGYTGVSEQNGIQKLLSSTGMVTPYKDGTTTADFHFQFTVPSGTNNFVDIKFVVNGTTYRSDSRPFLRSSGDTQQVSVSFTFPNGSEFLAHGGKFYINSSANITITNRYISVVQHGNF